MILCRRALNILTTSGDPTPLTQRKMYQIDGTSFEAEYRAIPITYAGNLAIQLVARDITERKQRRGADSSIAFRGRTSERGVGSPRGGKNTRN